MHRFFFFSRTLFWTLPVRYYYVSLLLTMCNSPASHKKSPRCTLNQSGYDRKLHFYRGQQFAYYKSFSSGRCSKKKSTVMNLPFEKLKSLFLNPRWLEILWHKGRNFFLWGSLGLLLFRKRRWWMASFFSWGCIFLAHHKKTLLMHVCECPFLLYRPTDIFN